MSVAEIIIRNNAMGSSDAIELGALYLTPRYSATRLTASAANDLVDCLIDPKRCSKIYNNILLWTFNIGDKILN